MENLPIDKLLEKQIKAARRSRIVRTIILIVVILLVIGCLCAVIVRSVKNRQAGDVTDDPAQTEPVDTETIETEPVDPASDAASSEAVEASAEPVEGQTEPVSTETSEPSKDAEPPVTEAPGQKQTEQAETEPQEPMEVPHEMRVTWTDDSPKPDSLEIHVMHDDIELFTAALNDENQWTFSWTDRYGAQELQFAANCPENMSMEFIASGDSFVIRTANVEGKLPQTGNNRIAGLFLVLAGMAVTIIGLAYKTKEEL